MTVRNCCRLCDEHADDVGGLDRDGLCVYCSDPARTLAEIGWAEPEEVTE